MSLENGLTNQFLDIPPATGSILMDLARRGIVLGLTSSHSIEWMENFLAEKRFEGVFSFLIGSNGAQYYSERTRTAITLCSITRAELLKLASSIESLPVSCGVVYQNELIFDKPGPYALAYALREHKKIRNVDLDSIPDTARFFKIVLCGSRTLLQKVESGFTVPGLHLLHSSPRLLEAVPAGCSIFHALEQAFEEFDVQPSHTLYFGQSDKDISALLYTYGIAMKDSPDAVSRACRRITKYNAAQNGIGYMLNSLRMDNTCVFRRPSPARDSNSVSLKRSERKQSLSGSV